MRPLCGPGQGALGAAPKSHMVCHRGRSPRLPPTAAKRAPGSGAGEHESASERRVNDRRRRRDVHATNKSCNRRVGANLRLSGEGTKDGVARSDRPLSVCGPHGTGHSAYAAPWNRPLSACGPTEPATLRVRPPRQACGFGSCGPKWVCGFGSCGLNVNRWISNPPGHPGSHLNDQETVLRWFYNQRQRFGGGVSL